MTKAEPWYLHAALYAVIVVLVIILIKVAILDPKEIVEQDKYYRTESRLRMKNLKEAEILWEHKYGRFTDNLDSLINFVKSDPLVDSVVNATDSITEKSSNPFVPLTQGAFIADSLFKTPKSQQPYIVQIDTNTNVDTVVNRQGKLLRIDSTLVIGSLYYIEDPDDYGSIGSLDNQALKNTASWE